MMEVTPKFRNTLWPILQQGNSTEKLPRGKEAVTIYIERLRKTLLAYSARRRGNKKLPKSVEAVKTHLRLPPECCHCCNFRARLYVLHLAAAGRVYVTHYLHLDCFDTSLFVRFGSF
ncbi:hypothetical protein DM860_006100 [Cuscuta australis]|uniref:Uncharacterized protein n=1 Tax=Cuscuta australis TaxID=267555 RepID=A0A328DKG5_9ASTE|nr:hypothetical protein DM860_006100 [Cuscuta australis]